jgi:hypothetical protein
MYLSFAAKSALAALGMRAAGREAGSTDVRGVGAVEEEEEATAGFLETGGMRYAGSSSLSLLEYPASASM